MRCQKCENRCHKQERCSKISRYGCLNSWTCSDHDVITAEPEKEQTSAKTGDCCSRCNEPLRVGQPALQCTANDCTTMCHKKESCSGIGRYSKALWKCPSHCLTIAGRPLHTLDQRPAPSLGSKCKSCKNTIKCNIRPVQCHTCKDCYHKSCLINQGHSRDAVEVISRLEEWNCDKCTSAPQAPPPSILDDPVETSQPFKGTQRETLKVLHWNADGLSTKWPELNERLKKEDIDIALIQETKYKTSTKLPVFHGYAPIRHERNGDGGGLLCLIKHDIPMYRPHYCNQTVRGVESTTFRVRIDKRKWITFSNVYIAPKR